MCDFESIQGDPEYMILFQHVITFTFIKLFQNLTYHRKLEISKFYLISESLVLKENGIKAYQSKFTSNVQVDVVL